MLEPVQWLPVLESNGVSGGSDVVTKREGVAFIRGQRAYFGSIKFNLCLTHVNRTGVMTAAELQTLGAGGKDAFSLTKAHAIGDSLPIMIRMCVVRLRGRDVDQLGNIWKSFDLLTPFPEASSKF